MKVINNIEIISPKGGFPEKAAEVIRKRLIVYKPPKEVIKRTGKTGLKDVDEQWLIIICGPAAQSNPEITKVVQDYIKDGKRERILALLAEGHSKESFPKELYYEIRPDGTRVDREPLGANITAPNEKKALKNIEVEKLRLLAPMLGVAFDDLLNRKRRQRRIVISSIVAALAISSSIFLGFAIYKFARTSNQNKLLSNELLKAEEARIEAEKERDAAKISLAESAALKAEEALTDGDTELALLIELEFLPEFSNVESLVNIFDETLQARCAQGYVPLTLSRSYNRLHNYEVEGTYMSGTYNFEERFGIYPREKNKLDEVQESIVDQSDLPITYYQYAYGFDDRIIGQSKDGVNVYNKDPFELLFTICDEYTTGAPCAPNGSTYWDGFIAAALPNGERRFVVSGQYVYDAENGEFLYEIKDFGQNYGVSRAYIEISSEGYMPIRIGDTVHIIDLTDGHDIGTIKDADRGEFSITGGKDPESGRMSAKTISMIDYFNSSPAVTWLYNEEEISIPDSLDDKIELAKTLLKGRTLTDKEKRENSLE